MEDTTKGTQGQPGGSGTPGQGQPGGGEPGGQGKPGGLAEVVAQLEAKGFKPEDILNLQAKVQTLTESGRKYERLTQMAKEYGYEGDDVEFVEALAQDRDKKYTDWKKAQEKLKEHNLLEDEGGGEQPKKIPTDELSPKQIMAMADNSRETQLTRFSLDERFKELPAETKTELDKTVKGWIRNNPDMLVYAKSLGITWHELAYNLKLAGDPQFKANLEKQAIAKEDARRTKNAQQETITSDIPAKTKAQLSELDKELMEAGT